MGDFNYDVHQDSKAPKERGKMVRINFREGVYAGEWDTEKKIRHGRGSMFWKNSSCYEGFWKNDGPHGRGRYV